jgi:hypothetical protein
MSDEKPQLVMSSWEKGAPLIYKCSLCGQGFLLPEDRSPKEGVAELWAAFNDHVREKHAEDVGEANS